MHLEKTTNDRRQRRYRKLAAASLIALLLGLFPAIHAFSLIALAGQPQQHTATKSKLAPMPASKEQLMPFRTGETLNYRVSWSAFSNAASLQLSAPERRDIFGWHAWHFRGEAHTLSPVRSFITIDDQLDSYTDAFTLESRQYETHLNELGKSTNEIQRLTPTGQRSRAPAPIVMVLPGTRDPLGALYTLRGVDWQRTHEVRAPVYDGHNVLDMRAALESAGESVKVPAGAYMASRVSIRVFQNQKELDAIHLTMWIASDSARTPVQMEADLPFGSLRAELTSATE
ncbi:MAG TPA: DUF3108 domain-containing protein [Candidatus Acidoferrum sp.]|nr:DUF3108 domain-containing protein [Candidatus Acidoferrum sp.]